MRLTEKDIAYLTSGANVVVIPDIVEGHKYTGQAIIKLGQLEDIEEELGIDLITLFKALKNGVYVKEGSGKIKYYNPDQIAVNWVGYYLEIVFLNTAKKGDYCALNTNAYKLPYTPTWALTKGELE